MKVFLLLSALLYFLRDAAWVKRHLLTVSVAAVIGGVGAIVWLMVTAYYLDRPLLLDHVEANLVSVAWAHRQGLPLYHDLAASDRYSLLYGPLAYLANTAILSLWGPSLFSAKVLGPTTVLASVGLIYGICQRWNNANQASLLVVLLCTYLLPHTTYTMSSRPDGLMILLSTLALALARPLFDAGEMSLIRAISIGLCIGLGLSCKVHAFVYFLPIIATMLWRRAFCATMIALTVALLPSFAFFLLDDVSAVHYLRLIRMATHHPLLWEEFADILTWQLLVALPLLFVAARLPSGDRAGRGFSVGIAMSGVLLLVFASKAGAGRHHILPMLPSYGVLLAWQWRQRVAWPEISRVFAASGFVVTVAFGLWVVGEMLVRSQTIPARDVVAELDRFFETVPAKDGMIGYSRSYDLANFRVLNVFSGARPFIEGAAEIDFGAAGQVPSQAVFDRLRQCPYAYWLIPKGEEPFSPTSFKAFNQFNSAFVAAYQMTSSMRYFDVWSCRGLPPVVARLPYVVNFTDTLRPEKAP